MMPSCDRGWGRSGAATRPGEKARKWRKGLFLHGGAEISTRGLQKVLSLSGAGCECKSHRAHCPRICWFPFLDRQQHAGYPRTSNMNNSELINASPLHPHVLYFWTEIIPKTRHVFWPYSAEWTVLFQGESPGPPALHALGGTSCGPPGAPSIGLLSGLPPHRSAKKDVGLQTWRQLEWGCFLQNEWIIGRSDLFPQCTMLS